MVLVSFQISGKIAEKNMHDILVQREQAERNRLAETLDADVRRWSNGKEGNLRALLSTLQYLLEVLKWRYDQSTFPSRRTSQGRDSEDQGQQP
ncbi:auxilin-related protein 2-like [Magnolia sinica]|uniref:auxilin-related protein 2-like n=1 Tax=Magnolia sinica TaxID=86752 RepID=UPI002657D96E|nr:auxilin-related protein 2-like [Magnolia sinica]